MELDNVKVKIAKLNKEIELRLGKIELLRQDCKHVNVTGEYRGNTGNYDPSADSYWIWAECDDCGRQFNIDFESEPELYRTFKFKRKN